MSIRKFKVGDLVTPIKKTIEDEYSSYNQLTESKTGFGVVTKVDLGGILSYRVKWRDKNGEEKYNSYADRHLEPLKVADKDIKAMGKYLPIGTPILCTNAGTLNGIVQSEVYLLTRPYDPSTNAHWVYFVREDGKEKDYLAHRFTALGTEGTEPLHQTLTISEARKGSSYTLVNDSELKSKLTKGKDYKVLKVLEKVVIVKSDRGKEVRVYPHRFNKEPVKVATETLNASDVVAGKYYTLLDNTGYTSRLTEGKAYAIKGTRNVSLVVFLDDHGAECVAFTYRFAKEPVSAPLAPQYASSVQQTIVPDGYDTGKLKLEDVQYGKLYKLIDNESYQHNTTKGELYHILKEDYGLVVIIDNKGEECLMYSTRFDATPHTEVSKVIPVVDEFPASSIPASPSLEPLGSPCSEVFLSEYEQNFINQTTEPQGSKENNMKTSAIPQGKGVNNLDVIDGYDASMLTFEEYIELIRGRQRQIEALDGIPQSTAVETKRAAIEKELAEITELFDKYHDVKTVDAE